MKDIKSFNLKKFPFYKHLTADVFNSGKHFSEYIVICVDSLFYKILL